MRSITIPDQNKRDERSSSNTSTDHTGLSHTRTDPPSLDELKADSSRQTRLRPMIEAIEAREREERIRQGYLPAPGTGIATGIEGERHAGMPRSIAGPSRINTRPSFSSTSQTTETGTDGQNQKYPTSTATGGMPPPGQTVDPIRHDDPAELRRLAEEDTKRRIEQRGGEGDLRPEKQGEGQGDDDAAATGGLTPRPRRRGKQ